MRIGTMLETGADPAPDAKDKPWVEARLAADHREAHRRATEAMLAPTLRRAPRHAPVDRERLRLGRHVPPSPHAANPPAAIRKDWHRLRKAAKAADRATNSTDRAARLHDVRKAAKRARYSAEAIDRPSDVTQPGSR